MDPIIHYLGLRSKDINDIISKIRILGIHLLCNLPLMPPVKMPVQVR
jgi:hypothetical protein